MEEKTYRIEKCDSKVQWDEFVLEHAGHPLQLWGWGDARTALGWQVERIFIVEDVLQIGAAQLLIHKLPKPFGHYVYIPRGPIVVENEATVYRQIAQHVARNHPGVALMVEPASEREPQEGRWRESEVHALPVKTLLLDLTKADGVLLADMDQATRGHIRTATAANLTIKKLGNPEDISSCYALYAKQMAKSGGKPHKEKYFLDLYDKLGDFSALFGAYEGESLVSFLWVTLSETIAFELYSGTTSRGRELAADYGLRWEAIRRVKQWGVKHYDVGGTDEPRDGDGKHGFGNQFTTYGTFVLPLSPLYALWARISRNRTHYSG